MSRDENSGTPAPRPDARGIPRISGQGCTARPVLPPENMLRQQTCSKASHLSHLEALPHPGGAGEPHTVQQLLSLLHLAPPRGKAGGALRAHQPQLRQAGQAGGEAGQAGAAAGSGRVGGRPQDVPRRARNAATRCSGRPTEQSMSRPAPRTLTPPPSTHLQARLCEPQVGVVGAQAQPELGAGGEHAVRLGGTAGHQVIYQHPRVPVGPGQQQRVGCSGSEGWRVRGGRGGG